MARKVKFINVGGVRVRADKTLAQLQDQRDRIAAGWRTSGLSNSRYTAMNTADRVGMQAFADGFGPDDYNRVRVGNLYGKKADKWRNDLDAWIKNGGGFIGSQERPKHPADAASKANSNG